MTGRAASVPVTHVHEHEVKVLYVGGDNRETLLKALRDCAFNRRRLPLQCEVVQKSRKVITTKGTVSGQAPRRALSAPLTFDHSRLANLQNYDAIALGRFDANIAGARVLSDVSRMGLSNPSGILPQPNGYARRASLSRHLVDETGLPAVSDVDQHPSFHERSFPKGTGTGKTRWFRSTSVHQLLCPNEDIVGAVGDLFVHTNTRSGITYLWVMHPDEGWVSIQAGGGHPTMPNRRLRIRKNGDPSWVQIRSLISMDSRERCR
ncbi:hypothetical protein CY34DRAFT_18447 [Suillus luteus UH-Slu-Lm8-n1]|uniref:Uncharacterized protein n=1 Tax=Suillus luteus UH-Slu-Lm8-n1 TaxID=930992 RepID=A0A0D0A519_9AGAM|nr:hypothetical protein CY34DRAFT_18447 [Suillus luteus UH-Slu-Lm8-n1]